MHKTALRSFLALSLALAAANLYDSNPEVVSLTASNFQTKVMSSDEVWLVEFYAPWCGHCKALAPAWIKAASALKGVVKVGAVNMDEHQSVGAPYGVKGFPTIKVFAGNKNSPTDYNSGRDAESIVQAGLQAAGQMVQARMGGGGSSGGAGGGASKVVELTDADFDEKVLGSKEPWLVAFVAPWCGHCKALHPNWESAARDMDGKPVKIGRVDATAQQGLAQKYGVQGFPTIKFFKDSTPEDYNGGRTASDIVQFLDNYVEESLPPPEVRQLTSNDVFTEECAKKSLCLVAFFPGMVDSSAKDRNGFIDIMKKLTEKKTLKKFGFVWAEAGQQQALEKAFNIGDYPTLAAMNGKKLKWTTMRGAFSEEEMSGFLGRLMTAREATSSLDKLPEVADVTPWDGKDVEVAVEEEEMSLDDIMNEELDET